MGETFIQHQIRMGLVNPDGSPLASGAPVYPGQPSRPRPQILTPPPPAAPMAQVQQPTGLSDQAEVDRFASEQYGAERVPQVAQHKGIHLGRLNVSGSTMEALTPFLTAIYNASKGSGGGDPSLPRIGLEGYLAGQQARKTRNEESVKSAKDFNKERRTAASSYARDLANWRHRGSKESGPGAYVKPTEEQWADLTKRGYKRAPDGFAPRSWLEPESLSGDENIDYEGIADMVDSGLLPPTMVAGRSTKYNYLLASALKKRGTNLSMKMADYNAATAWLRAANSTTQVRFRQALKAIPGLIGEVQDLNRQLQSAGVKENRIPLVNRVGLGVIQGGFSNDPAVQNLVTRYITVVNAIPSEVGYAEMGGTSPTDKAMDRAVKQFNQAYGFEQADSALDEILRLATIRENTMNLVGTVAPSNPTGAGGWYYGQQQGPPPPPASSDTAPSDTTGMSLAQRAAAHVAAKRGKKP